MSDIEHSCYICQDFCTNPSILCDCKKDVIFVHYKCLKNLDFIKQ